MAMTWGTNLFHYGVYDSVFSHVYSFFLISVLVALTEGWWANPTPVRSIATDVVAAAIFLTRHTNVIFLLMIPLYGVYGVTTWRALRERTSSQRTATFSGDVASCQRQLLTKARKHEEL